MAGRGQAPHGTEQAEPVPMQAHWPQARQPAPNGYANQQADQYAQQQSNQPAANGYHLPHEIQAPLPPQPRHDWSNVNGFERDLRAFAQIGREQQQQAEPAFTQHQPQAPYQSQAPAGQWQGAAQTHAYPGQHQQAYPGQHTGYQDPQPYGHHAQAQDPRYEQWPEQPSHTAEPYNLDHYAQQGGQPGYPNQLQHTHGQEAGEHAEIEEYEEETERRRGPRAVVVIGALVGALAIGGGLAYGYRMLGGASKGKDGKPPVVKADTAPAKVKPADGGGKDIAHTDKKFLNRLAEDGKATAASAAGPAAGATPNEPEAPRKVTTLVVNRDGTLTPQANLAPPSAQPSPAPAAVPGMVLEGGPRAPLRGAASETPSSAAAPKVAELPLPRVKTEPAQSAAVSFPAPADPKAAEPKATVAKKKPAPRDDAASPQATTTATAAVPAPGQAKATVSSSGGTVLGFVPVLTSKKTREEALKSFADLHQKYPDILGSKSPDVVQADIPEKGTFFRLIIGPPGSREAGREICNKLDAQGYKGCWITAYRQ